MSFLIIELVIKLWISAMFFNEVIYPLICLVWSYERMYMVFIKTYSTM